MDEVIRFSFKGKEYTGDVLSSLDMTPHYHWLIFRQPEMQKLLGEEIAFVVRNAELTPVNIFLAQKNRELFNAIVAAMQKHLNKASSNSL